MKEKVEIAVCAAPINNTATIVIIVLGAYRADGRKGALLFFRNANYSSSMLTIATARMRETISSS